MTKMTTKVKTQKSEKVWFFLGALAVFLWEFRILY